MIFDTTTIPKLTRAILPPGTYNFSISELEKKSDKNNNIFISLKADVMHGDKSVKIFDRFYLSHSNAKAVEVGRGRFKSFLASCGFSGALDIDKDLHHFIDSEFMAKVKTGKDMQDEAQTQFSVFIEKSTPFAKAPPRKELSLHVEAQNDPHVPPEGSYIPF